MRLQKKGGQAMLDMLAEQATAYDQLDFAFQKDQKIEDLLLKEDTLAESVTD